MAEAAAAILVIGYILVAFGLAIAASSMMIYQNNNETWNRAIRGVQVRQGQGPANLMRSWSAEPFMEIKAFDAEEYYTCPGDLPDEVVYDIWLGTR